MTSAPGRCPKAQEPAADIRRATASVEYNRPFNGGNWASAFVWGRNHVSEPGAVRNLNGYTLESFGRNLLKIINPATGRLHAHFRQIGTPTGRIICERPNLQQLPKEGEVRGVFCAPPGRLLITADYSTIELRILAEVTGDGRLREVFLKGRDPHRETAARIFGCAPEDVTPQMRAVGKGLNYGVAYGIEEENEGRKIRLKSE